MTIQIFENFMKAADREIERKRVFSGAVIFETPDAMINALFGPPQHDAHVKRRHQHQWLAARQAAFDSANDRVDAEIKEAGSITAWLKASFEKHMAGQ